jgi:hypothetical protein
MVAGRKSKSRGRRTEVIPPTEERDRGLGAVPSRRFLYDKSFFRPQRRAAETTPPTSLSFPLRALCGLCAMNFFCLSATELLSGNLEINYKTTPNWDKEVQVLTGGKGAMNTCTAVPSEDYKHLPVATQEPKPLEPITWRRVGLLDPRASKK